MPQSTLRAFLAAVSLAYALAWFLPRVTAKGLFSDGLVYTVIAHNLSHGIGTPWAPVIRNNGFLFHPQDVFYEHPPLVMWIESVFYRLAGTHTEWLYNTLVMLLIVLVSSGLLRRMHPGRDLGPLSWGLPLLFLFLAPEWAKKSAYNLLDTSMALFAAAAVYAILRGMTGTGPRIPWMLAGGVAIVGAFLAKGPVGLFPLVAPLIYGYVNRETVTLARSAKAAAWVAVPPLLAAAAIMASPPARDFMAHYLNQQVLDSLSGQREAATTLANHLGILVKIAEQTAPMLALVVIIRWGLSRGKTIPPRGTSHAARLFLLIGLSASVPMVVSAKHHSFYLFPALVFFALAAASLLIAWIPDPAWRIRRRGYTIGILAAWIGIATVLAVSLQGERYYRTHAGFLSVMDELVAGVPDGATVAASSVILGKRADVNGYLERYHDMVLTADLRASDYYLAMRIDSLPDRPVLSETALGDFRLVRWAVNP